MFLGEILNNPNRGYPGMHGVKRRKSDIFNVQYCGNWIEQLYLDSMLARGAVGDAEISKIFQAFSSRLRRLDLTGCNRMKSPKIPRALSLERLQALSVADCRHLSEKSLCSLLKACPKLEILSLNNVDAVTDAVLQTIAVHCKYVSTLSVNGCHKITDEGMVTLLNCLVSLRELSASSTELGDKSMHALAARFPNIGYLRLTNCRKISDNGLIPVVRSCSGLIYLFVAACSITNSFLESFTKNNSAIRFLDLAYSEDISLRGLSYVLTHCTQLVSLGLGACVRLTNNHVVRLLSETPPMDFPESLSHLYCVIKGQDVERLRELLRSGVLALS
jgi:hypothetical protein